ncbi:hypothetical protein, conserved [Eimeria tenella]|uniref:Uncharacterized protein n=1 Tax=Eimeria tenella TaxID=5802 RepID=U6LBI1_EIMTE|nr:hypothetical protein, conserved [Eimeria tenella]CDJ45120.1 hypothetical protein, conserved [Eimeria tenella]|eukprot:XP_013235867.1 hypothetical protein, conserved [Eimeria tenella]
MAGRTLPPVGAGELQPSLMEAGGLPVRIRQIFSCYQQSLGPEAAAAAAAAAAADRNVRPLQSCSKQQLQLLRLLQQTGCSKKQLLLMRQTSCNAAERQQHLLLLLQFSCSNAEAAAAAAAAANQLQHSAAAAAAAGQLRDGAPRGRRGPPFLPLATGSSSRSSSSAAATAAQQQQRQQQGKKAMAALRCMYTPNEWLDVEAGPPTIKTDGDILLKGSLYGLVLRAWGPPLAAGRHCLSVQDGSGAPHSLRFGALAAAAAAAAAAADCPLTEQLPLLVLPPPSSSKLPRLCYSKQRSSPSETLRLFGFLSLR